MVKLLTGAFPGPRGSRDRDAAFHGQALIAEGATWTTRLPANAVLYGPRPPRTGKRGRPRSKMTCSGSRSREVLGPATAGRKRG